MNWHGTRLAVDALDPGPPRARDCSADQVLAEVIVDRPMRMATSKEGRYSGCIQHGIAMGQGAVSFLIGCCTWPGL